MNGAHVWAVEAFRAECLDCGWKGPYHSTRYDAYPDQRKHECEE